MSHIETVVVTYLGHATVAIPDSVPAVDRQLLASLVVTDQAAISFNDGVIQYNESGVTDVDLGWHSESLNAYLAKNNSDSVEDALDSWQRTQIKDITGTFHCGVTNATESILLGHPNSGDVLSLEQIRQYACDLIGNIRGQTLLSIIHNISSSAFVENNDGNYTCTYRMFTE